jgi:hypothetical protein
VKTKLTKWFKEHTVLRAVVLGILALLLISAMLLPYAQAASPLDVTGTYTVSRTVPVQYLDGSRHPAMPVQETLTITTQSGQVISVATLTTLGETVPLAGLVGSGSNPWISLKSTGSAVDTFLTINGKVAQRRGEITGISGTITGYVVSDGYKWDLSDTGTAATYTGANAYGGSGYCTLLTAGAGAGAECIQINHPANNFKLSQLKTLGESSRNGLSFYYKLESAKANGPYIGLRFAPEGVTGTDLFSSVSHVDITIGELYSATGDGTWQQYTVTKDSARIYYYGNAPDDQASFAHPGDYVATLDLVEDLINAEPEMLNGTAASASNWVLTAIYIDLYEAGARTCYIDNIQVGRYTYTLEPAQFNAAFRATLND